MFSRRRPQTKRTSFGPSSNPASPVQGTFDFQLRPVEPAPPPSFSSVNEGSISRPRTSHGVSAEGKKPAGLQLLPPIPRVASRQSSMRSTNEEMDGSDTRDESDNVSVLSQKAALKAQPSLEQPAESTPMAPISPPMTPSRDSTVQERPTTSGGDSSNSGTPEMTSSLFPARRPSPVSAVSAQSASSEVLMDRSFIDARDRVYQPQPQRLLAMHHNHSSPNLMRSASPATTPRHQPTTPIFTSTRNWISPMASMQNLSSRSTNLSGSTASPITKAPSPHTAHSSSHKMTIGTPYQSTADSYPPPQEVRTRPKTPSATATVAGISIPTHHTSRVRIQEKPPEPPKKKGRLRNPLLLLQRRRNSQGPEVVVEERTARQAQAQALARQRDVVASGVNKPPPDFDPRIKGKVVHDFSAPRGKRNTFDGMDLPLSLSGIQSTDSAPALASGVYPPRNASLVNRGPGASTDSEQRRSVHTPVFVEHLSEHPEASRRISSIHAENLENKDFLQRASKAATLETTALPPFARRSQILDATQASLCQDDESKRSSNPSSEKDRDSTLGSISEVSPITARSSSHNVEARGSFSPVSPSSPGKPFRPLSDDSALPRPVSETSKSSLSNDSIRPVSQLSDSLSPQNHRKTASEVTATPSSVILVPSAINTIAEGSVESSPIEPSSVTRRTPHDAQDVARGVTVRASGMPGSALDSLEAPKTYTRELGTDPSTTQSILERTTALSTPERSPEPEVVQSIQFKPNKGQPKLVEKRASAVGHSRKSSNVPKHHASNASRFSFQFASESAAQEQALEEKHRKMQSREIAHSIPRGRSPDEDDEDGFFDEDAMDDMDEIEMQAAQQGEGDDQLEVPTQNSQDLQQARQALHKSDLEEASVNDEDNVLDVNTEEDGPYADHPAFRTHSALVNYWPHNSYLHTGTDSYWHGGPIEHDLRYSYHAPTWSRVQSQASGFHFDFDNSQDRPLPLEDLPSTKQTSRAEPDVYIQLDKSIDAPNADNENSPVPPSDSGNSKRDRIVSGMSTGIATEKNASANSTTSMHEYANPKLDHVVSEISYSHVSDGTRSSNNSALNLDTQNRGLSHDVSMSMRPLQVSNDVNSHSTASSSHLSKPSIIEASPEGRVGSQATDEWQQNSEADLASRTRSSGETSNLINLSPYLGSDAFAGLDFHDIQLPFATHSDSGNSASNDILLSRVGTRVFDNALTEALGPDLQTSNKVKLDNTNSAAPHTGPRNSSFSHTRFNSAQQPATSTPVEHQRLLSEGAVQAVSTAPSQGRITSLGHSAKDSQAMPQPDSSKPQNHSSGALDPLPGHDAASSSISTPKIESKETSHQKTSTDAFASALETMNRSLQDTYNREDDDIYFDDGNFDQDIKHSHGESIDENIFDDDGFLARPGMMKAVNHRRDNSAVTYSSLGSDGPYHSFAAPSASRASQRLSQMMLDDLPLQVPVDPQYMPQRNPSEDMKRMGRSDRVPPVPIPENNKEAFTLMQANLQNYHAALAKAANQAAADGRFMRAPSVSTTRSVSSMLKVQDNKAEQTQDNKSINDDRSIYSNDEASGNLKSRSSGNEKSLAVGRSGTTVSHLSHLTTYSPPKMSFDFGFDAPSDDDDDLFGGEDDLVAAANAEALASDVEGFYGQEFDFYGRPRADSGELQAVNGGFFGEHGDDGLQRNKSLMEPNLTPITERSEFSTRNSFIAGQFGPSSAGPYGPHSPALARMPVSPLHENDVTSFDDLRRLKANAFGDSSSLRSSSNRSSAHSLQAAFSPTLNARTNYFGSGAPSMQFAYSTDSSGSSNPNVPQTGLTYPFQESPKSAASSAGMPFPMDVDATPKKNGGHSQIVEPTTARKIPPSQVNAQSPFQTHSRNGSGADSIGYVQEPDPENNGRPRWVLERRRKSEQGMVELVGREIVHSGWI